MLSTKVAKLFAKPLWFDTLFSSFTASKLHSMIIQSNPDKLSQDIKLRISMYIKYIKVPLQYGHILIGNMFSYLAFSALL